MDDVVKNVCAELGVAPGASPPKCELYKLLLYEAGSHFLPHQDTEKAPGMFATVIIVLPSFYNGGQVHVSHGSQKQVFDFASSSESTYSLLTWYADVMHEVKPITAGHRLALSFNLIHTAPSLPAPAPSSMNTAKSELKHILHKWSKKAYAGAPQTIAYLLQHQYSQVDLAMGVNALKGVDAYLVGALREASAEEGIAVGLAELECHIMGDAGEDFGMGYSSKRARYDDYDDEEDEDMYSDDYDDTPTMGEETERSMTVSNLVDLNGVNLIGKGTISLGEEELIPKDAFENEDPDDQDYEGYMGNYPGSVEYWYHRTAIVLYLKANAQNILLEAGGITYAVAQLKSNNPTLPTPQDTAFANYIADHLSVQHINAGYYVADLALRWKNAPLWFKVACKCGADKNPDTLGKERLTAAWAVLGFEAIRPLFERAIAQCETLKNQVVMINSFSSRATSTQDQAVVTVWASEQTTFALEHLKPPTKEDVPIFIGVLKSKGMAFFVETLQPQLAKYETTYSFLTEFVKVLHANKTKLSNPPSTQGAFKQSVIYCLTAAVAQWKHSVRSQYGYIYGPAHHRAEHSLGRIKELVALCVSTGEMEPCEKLFSSLIQDSTGLQTKYKDIFIPLIPELRRILNSRNVGLDTRPFGDFFCYLIETYLHTVLGAKGARMRHNAIRKLGCGCSECQALDSFIFSTEATHTFRYVQARRKHLEQRLSTASDIATFTTIRSGSPHGLQVTKHS
ncbi:hypothetical protein DFH11DRAFT_710036 [Phellopilus nigrolimitatus]|nr:hypothetical protein DFH11DRAFT_710036 [Phellopilus nigrolimitatus]